MLLLVHAASVFLYFDVNRAVTFLLQHVIVLIVLYSMFGY